MNTSGRRGPRPRTPAGASAVRPSAGTLGRLRTAMFGPGRRARWRRTVWRRWVAALLCGVAAWVAVGVLRPAAPPLGRAVLTASVDRPAGYRLTDDDLEVHRVPDGVTPAAALTDPHSVVGSVLTSPVAEGEVLTPLRVRVGSMAGQLGADQRAVRLPLADATTADLLRPGDHVDVLGVRDGRTVAADVLVLTVDAPPPGGPGLTGGTNTGRGIVVAAPVAAAGPLTQAALADGHAAGVHVAVRAPMSGR